jgi:hypothetical protein
MNTAKSNARIKFLSAVVAFMGAAGSAHAGDLKSYPGTFCQAQGHGSHLFYQGTGTAMNNSTSADMNALCPIVRDEVRADGTAWARLYVTTLNLHPTLGLWCDARSYHPDDYQFAAIVRRRGQAPNTGWDDLDMGTLAAPNPGYFLVICTIPRKAGEWPSGIASYHIDE